MILPSKHRWTAALTVPVLLVSLRASAEPPAAGAGAAPTASASAKAPPKPADKAAAKKLLTQGNQLVGEGDYVGALEKFRAAHDRYPSPKILLNIGTTLRQLGRNVEAAEVYESYLKDPEHDAAREGDVQRVLVEIDAVVGHIAVTVDEPTATLRLDGKPIEPFAKGETRRVEPGEHTLTAEKPGVSPVVQSVFVKPRHELTVNLRFAAAPHKQDGLGTVRTIGLALGGVGAVTLLAGAVVGVVAASQSGAASDHCYKGGLACDEEGVRIDQNAKTSATLSTVGFAVGGGLLAAGALIFILSPGPAKARQGAPATSRAEPGVGPWISIAPRGAGAGLTFGGAF